MTLSSASSCDSESLTYDEAASLRCTDILGDVYIVHTVADSLAALAGLARVSALLCGAGSGPFVLCYVMLCFTRTPSI